MDCDPLVDHEVNLVGHDQLVRKRKKGRKRRMENGKKKKKEGKGRKKEERQREVLTLFCFSCGVYVCVFAYVCWIKM